MMLSPRLIALVVGLVALIGLGYGIGEGFLTWSKDSYKCYGGQKFYSAVDKQRWLSIGSLHLSYQPLTFGCEERMRYDRSKFTVQQGQIVPIEK